LHLRVKPHHSPIKETLYAKVHFSDGRSVCLSFDGIKPRPRQEKLQSFRVRGDEDFPQPHDHVENRGTKGERGQNQENPKIRQAFRPSPQNHVTDHMMGNNIYSLHMVPKRSWSLKELLSGITERNLHEEIETGKPVAREVW
jgi:hypothetical protein